MKTVKIQNFFYGRRSSCDVENFWDKTGKFVDLVCHVRANCLFELGVAQKFWFSATLIN